MKLNKSIIFMFCLLLSVSMANTAERASISATATVIPVLGFMPNIDQIQSLSITESSDSKLLIQAPKNSALQIHIERAGESVSYPKTLLSSTKSNSVSDLYTIDVSSNQTPQIVTIITTDN